jgi:MFS family permease
LQFASGMFGWRAVTVAAAGVGLLLGLVVWLMVRDDPADRNYDSYVNVHVQGGHWSAEWKKLTAVFGYRNTCLLAIAPGGIVGSVLTFAGLWGMPFLTDVYGLSPAAAATLCSVLMFAMAFSGPLFALLSERISRRRTPYLVATVLAFCSWTLALLVPDLPLWLLVSALVSAGFFSGAMILGFTQAKESVPLVLAGTISGVINMGVMCGPMLLQPLIGWLLDRFWRGMTGTDGMRVYHFDNYRVSFLLMLAWLAIAIVSIALTRETRCEQMSSADRARPGSKR